LILRKISKIGATRCQILRLKCTKFDYRGDSATDPAGGTYSAPRPLAVFKRPTSKGREGKEERRKGKGRVWEGKERKVGPQLGSLDPPVITSAEGKRLCFHPCLSVCLSVGLSPLDYSKSYERILMNFLER